MLEDQHVLPINDLEQHDSKTKECWCSPKCQYFEETDCWVVIHNSVDGREYFEEDNKKYGKIN